MGSPILRLLTSDIVAYEGEYSTDHPVLQQPSLADQKVIALFKYGTSHYAAFFNTEDRRGYRCVVILYDPVDMLNGINRLYTSEEKIGLCLVCSLIQDIYQRLKVPNAQTFMLGNHGHVFVKEFGFTCLGTKDYPSFLHAHLVGRGDPAKEYIKGVRLEGPAFGKEFSLMANNPKETGNDVKVPWTTSEMRTIRARFRKEIRDLKQIYCNCALQINISDTGEGSCSSQVKRRTESCDLSPGKRLKVHQ